MVFPRIILLLDDEFALAVDVLRFDVVFTLTFEAFFVLDLLEGEAIFSAGRVLATTLRAVLLSAPVFEAAFFDETRLDDAIRLVELRRLEIKARLEDATRLRLAAGLRDFVFTGVFAGDFFVAGFFALLFEGDFFVAAFLAGFFFAAAFFARLAILRRLPYSNSRRYSGRP